LELYTPYPIRLPGKILFKQLDDCTFTACVYIASEIICAKHCPVNRIMGRTELFVVVVVVAAI
jgi:hypothetical protein